MEIKDKTLILDINKDKTLILFILEKELNDIEEEKLIETKEDSLWLDEDTKRIERILYDLKYKNYYIKETIEFDYFNDKDLEDMFEEYNKYKIELREKKLRRCIVD